MARVTHMDQREQLLDAITALYERVATGHVCAFAWIAENADASVSVGWERAVGGDSARLLAGAADLQLRLGLNRLESAEADDSEESEPGA